MSERIRITPERLEEVAALFDVEKENTKECLADLAFSLNWLTADNEWIGKACNDFHKEWDKVFLRTDRLADTWGDVANNLRRIAARFREADQTMLSEGGQSGAG